MNDLNFFYYNSPVGILKISATDEFVSSILFIEEGISLTQRSFINPIIHHCIVQLEEYFSGRRKTFDFPMQQDGTPFQQKVWAELQKIPFGETISYLELAKRLGDVKSIRAAGTANGKNKLAIVVPCHRVIGSNGKLVGYAGGLERKKELLLHEAQFTVSTTTLF